MTNIISCPDVLKNPEQLFPRVMSLDFGDIVINKEGDEAFIEYYVRSSVQLDDFKGALDEGEYGFEGTLILSMANLTQLIKYGQSNQCNTYQLRLTLNYLTQANDMLKAPTNNTPALATRNEKSLSWPTLNKEHFPPKPPLKRRPRALKR